MLPVVSAILLGSKRWSRHVAGVIHDWQRHATPSCTGAQTCADGFSQQFRHFGDWRSMFRSSSGSGSAAQQSVGLFGRPELKQPQDWKRLADETEARCDELLAEVLECTAYDGVRVVALMDAMSDQLCRTYDAAECCRNVHVDAAWRQAAGRACVQLGAYISRVNHHEGLYGRLSEALEVYEVSVEALARREAPLLQPNRLAGWCPESVLVAQRLKQDMEQAGIHLPPDQRERMAELAAANGHFGAEFNAALTDPRQVGRVSLGFGRSAPLDPSSVASIMASEPSESVRRQVYLAAGLSPDCNQRLLEDMIAVRRDMARMQGYASYASLRTCGGSLAGSPSAVVTFLGRLAEEVRPLAEQELQALGQLKAAHMRSGASSPSSSSSKHPFGGKYDMYGKYGIAPWDVEYYAALARRQRVTSPPTALLRYTAVPSVLSGIRTLLANLFGMDLSISPAAPGEGWAPGVLRCDASLPQLGPLGTIYLDLGDRPGKYPSAVTFPITCGRQLPADRNPRQQQPQQQQQGPPRQLPVMALLASASGRCPATGQQALSYRELRVLLHELGHCCHSLLSRTKYQHLWGTRCAQDLVEVPSHLFEHFASDPRVMAVLARDRSGAVSKSDQGEPLPEGLLRELLSGRATTAALELQQQLVLSLADQWYHGEHPPGLLDPPPPSASAASGSLSLSDLESYSSISRVASLLAGVEAGAEAAGRTTSEVWGQAVETASSVPYVPGTSPELRVGHLAIYGGTYYGYVYARCLAAQLWHTTGLAEAPMDRGAGNLLRDRLLGPGGSLEPLHLIAGLAAATGGGTGSSGNSNGAGSSSSNGNGNGSNGKQQQRAPVRDREQQRQLQAAEQQRGLSSALGEGRLLQALAGGYAPRPDRYLEGLEAGTAV
ncbi:hypothetical protein Agub_g9412 [Astrephomene gubernaculifera]|uniref:Peptidase M3A/M3B catalytic domain-containing protein n=1 Tax=Astrephomene gubernaculifera TaxID=47775 RepID=A0AAD3DTP7_9CHLO|nr:hypothetical protein Agub_g9412 [Astrephomene gubernaculifera]